MIPNSFSFPAYCAANQAGVTTSSGLTTAAQGLILSNPNASQVRLVIERVGFSFVNPFNVAAAIGFAVGTSLTDVVHTTPLSVVPVMLGSQTGYGLCDSAATLPTAPVVTHIFATGLTDEVMATQIIDLNGSLAIPPGGYALIFTSNPSGVNALYASVQWTEFPL